MNNLACSVFFPASDIQTTQLSLHPTNPRGKSQQKTEKNEEKREKKK
jgi:hypothetical protein